MNLKRTGVAAATAALVMFPLAACGSANAPVVTTVTATPTTLSPGFQKSYCDINSATKDACAKHDADVLRRQTTAQQQSKSSGLPWWSWLLIVPAGLVAALVIGLKALEWNDDRTIARAEARVDELDARPRPVVDYDDYENDDEDDELGEEDMSFLDRVTDPTPSAPAAPVQPAAGNLLSSLRQGGAQ
ncbi:putative lipoprotein [Mycobacteroides abscessus subsp. abscessus]|uniref:Lipoprotein n=1 Tax=Mycobacteroides abscessus subsp. bolletii TaxID=319705 RepID=A0A9Q7SH90_9MYCO|nr:hypothetical protein [Mycobacteroides abscessus]SHU55540.1 putative lipoprotein [Mycobacteroides abscessus subsp. bolletii]SHU73684.1 putative lipoprotein [Mycobacteroides abscessus subsp. bolletii]SHX83441.1 putative lipoprotein [Mycobacteroides abscessus subsp. bolletii]SID82375.1 Uncharacterised protein [Mycobacteroides abscessus subsp. abscessus]SIF85549.1 putative lipoprotein [Mycobacteroides abscessus subsp. abscessus]